MRLLFKIIIILFLLFEIAFSFKRYYYFNIDGDFPAIVLPDKSYQTVLSDPLGFNVLLHDSIYGATNRFFTHLSMSVYFKNAPLVFQHIVSPIDSIYISCAFAKTVIQIFLIYLLAIYITGKKKIWDFDFLLAATLITPLFQIFGYNILMGIIDHSITYTFFYAFALSFILLFFLPFFNAFFQRHDFRFNTIITASLILLSIILAFNGPLNAPIILIICPLVIILFFWNNFKYYKDFKVIDRIRTSIKNIPPQLIFIFGFAIVICLYSLYIGKNNSENFWESIPLNERYARLPHGFFFQFTEKLGPSLIIIMILVNSFIIRNNKSDEKVKKMLRIIKWGGILSIVYILLLPLGGYRAYRPNIIRMDTIMPVTLSLILFYGLSTFYIIKNMQFKFKKIYYVTIIIFMSIFVNADTTVKKNNTCERNAFEKISQSSDNIIFLDNDCSVMSWGKTLNYRDSEIKTELLQHWEIIKEKKFFYQK